MGTVTWIDWAIWVVYFTFFILVAWVYRSTRSNPAYKYFLKGILIKVFGGVVFAAIYVYYYGFGDTFLYHRGAVILSQTLIENPTDYFRLLLSNNANLPADLQMFSESIKYSNTYEEWVMVKLLSPISFISFQSYLVTTLFMSFISFVGSWKLFLVFKDILPKYTNYAFLAVFLVPSVVFWGGGIMKDTITLFGINYLIYVLYFGLFKEGFKWRQILFSFVLIYLIVLLKAYIVLAFLPGIFLGFYVLFKKKMDNALIRFMVGPLIFLFLAGTIYLGLNQITNNSTKYRTENLEWQVKGFHSWHTDVGGSSYNLGEIEYTPIGVLRKVPAALNVTFFRPYLWEARNPVVFMGAIESFIFLLFFLYVLFKAKFRFISIIIENPLLYGLFVFCLIFGFSVGFTSYNFGALARYKIPVMPCFVFILLYVYHKSNESIILEE